MKRVRYKRLTPVLVSIFTLGLIMGLISGSAYAADQEPPSGDIPPNIFCEATCSPESSCNETCLSSCTLIVGTNTLECEIGTCGDIGQCSDETTPTECLRECFETSFRLRAECEEGCAQGDFTCRLGCSKDDFFRGLECFDTCF